MFGKRLRAAVAFLLAERTRVHGRSMYPTLAPDEWVLFDRLIYRTEKPARGDIVLARDPRQRRRLIVKRVTGVPGDETADGRLGPEQYFLQGDNPESSTDSRTYGPVRRADLIGRGWLVYWPAERFRVIPSGPLRDSSLRAE